MKTTILFKIQFLIAFLFFNAVLSQNRFAGIEIGSKGVKVTVIEVKNIKKGIYEIKGFWTENVGIAKGISINGNLAQADIDKAGEVVFANYQKLLNEEKIEDNKIYIVASSGVGMAKNTDVLVNKIFELTNKKIEIISSQLESKLSFKGCIPPKSYNDALLIDIGGGNTKGGYVDVINDENTVFFPINLNLGTVTLTEKINKKGNVEQINQFTNESISYRKTLEIEVVEMLKQRPLTLNKKSIYTSGGAVWAFYTLHTGTVAPDNYNRYTLEDVQDYNELIQYNYQKFVEIAKTDTEVAAVLKTYSQKHLISANNILLTTLQNIPDIASKKIVFVKQGQIAWLLSYVADSAKGARVIY